MLMQTFSIRPDGFKAIKKQILFRTVPTLIFAATLGIAISNNNLGENEDSINVLPIIIPFITLVIGFSLYIGLNRQKLIFNSYKLTVSQNQIIREQLNTQTISIYHRDIIVITKQKNGGFIINGKDPSDKIYVPAQIDNYLHLEKVLNEIYPVTYKSTAYVLDKFQVVISLLSLILFYIIYTVDNKIVIGFSGPALTAILIWSFFKIQKNKNIDKRTKSMSWIFLIVLFSVIALTIIKLAG
jgi:hypothetical protein